ncbi:response regulator [Nocardioides marmotae]|uniref:response regulator n=1 Tax=Nocardioides marmotae TaxID=2663857 RepID=UPI0018A79EB0|nr:response regulator [Nocardioides marmotae]
MSRADEQSRVDEHRVAVVVEDDPDTARLLEVILTQAGFEVHVAADGPSGVEAVRRHRPVLTTVDVWLPGIDGFEVTRQVRTFSDTYLVMVSALGGEDDILGGFEAGADDYVRKPFRPRELRARVLGVMRRPPARIRPAAPVVAPADPPWADPPWADPPWADPAAPVPEPSAVVPEPPAPPPQPAGPVVFDGALIRFRGLLVDPGAGTASADGRLLALDRMQFDLLELLLYSGEHPSTAGSLALSLRGEPYQPGAVVAESDEVLVTQAVHALLAELGDHRPDPRWIEVLPGPLFRLVPPA